MRHHDDLDLVDRRRDPAPPSGRSTSDGIGVGRLRRPAALTATRTTALAHRQLVELGGDQIPEPCGRLPTALGDAPARPRPPAADRVEPGLQSSASRCSEESRLSSSRGRLVEPRPARRRRPRRTGGSASRAPPAAPAPPAAGPGRRPGRTGTRTVRTRRRPASPRPDRSWPASSVSRGSADAVQVVPRGLDESDRGRRIGRRYRESSDPETAVSAPCAPSRSPSTFSSRLDFGDQLDVLPRQRRDRGDLGQADSRSICSRCARSRGPWPADRPDPRPASCHRARSRR